MCEYASMWACRVVRLLFVRRTFGGMCVCVCVFVSVCVCLCVLFLNSD